VNVSVTSKIVSHTVQRGVKLIPEVKNIVAIASGKGGVGNIDHGREPGACARGRRARSEARCDIYGPSQPMMSHHRRPSPGTARPEPMMGHGIQAISIGFSSTSLPQWCWRGRW